jgi:hypothetical protein
LGSCFLDHISERTPLSCGYRASSWRDKYWIAKSRLDNAAAAPGSTSEADTRGKMKHAPATSILR